MQAERRRALRLCEGDPRGDRRGPPAEPYRRTPALELRPARPGIVAGAFGVRIPTKPAMHSKMKPAPCSDFIPAAVPI
ncbi:hypothetical protein VQ042_15995 [Aurantimonas sp. A2-1-M11]